MKYTGALSFFFPCKIKDEEAIRRLNKRWNKWRIKREEFIKKNNEPLTDLMDLEADREWNECLLSMLQGAIAKDSVNPNIRPYALKCLQTAYHHKREDTLFSKSVNVVLSYFHLKYENKESKTIECDGTLLFNVNADNKVGTFIITLNFDNRTTDEIIILKHIFYKRLKVSITDYGYSCDGVCNLYKWGCLRKSNNLVIPCDAKTIPQYVLSKCIGLNSHLEQSIDFRARYSLLDIKEAYPPFFLSCSQKDIYGLLTADEMYCHVPCKIIRETIKADLSTRKYHNFYLNNKNGLIIYDDDKYINQYLNGKQKFKDKLTAPDSHINPDEVNFGSCISGVKENYFPEFLKSVELHYLLNLIQTNEIGHREQSFWNLFILFRRIKKLWNVIYELDFNRYHINQRMLQSYGINRMIKEIRDEFSMTLTHIIGYIALIFTLLQFIL